MNPLIILVIFLVLVLCLSLFIRWHDSRPVKRVGPSRPIPKPKSLAQIRAEKEKKQVKKRKTPEEIRAEWEEKCRKAGSIICLYCDKHIVLHKKNTIRKVREGYVAQSCFDLYINAREKEEIEKKQEEIIKKQEEIEKKAENVK